MIANVCCHCYLLSLLIETRKNTVNEKSLKSNSSINDLRHFETDDWNTGHADFDFDINAYAVC